MRSHAAAGTSVVDAPAAAERRVRAALGAAASALRGRRQSARATDTRRVALTPAALARTAGRAAAHALWQRCGAFQQASRRRQAERGMRCSAATMASGMCSMLTVLRRRGMSAWRRRCPDCGFRRPRSSRPAAGSPRCSLRPGQNFTGQASVDSTRRWRLACRWSRRIDDCDRARRYRCRCDEFGALARCDADADERGRGPDRVARPPAWRAYAPASVAMARCCGRPMARRDRRDFRPRRVCSGRTRSRAADHRNLARL